MGPAGHVDRAEQLVASIDEPDEQAGVLTRLAQARAEAGDAVHAGELLIPGALLRIVEHVT